jgi:hypothetical protein
MKLYDINTHINANKKSLHKFFDNVLGKKKFILLVHADWCGHCQTMKEGWKQAKKVVKRKPGVVIVEVEYTVYNHFINHHKDHTFSKVLKSSVSGFPCIVRVGQVNGGNVDIDEFQGKRDQNDMVSFMLG